MNPITQTYSEFIKAEAQRLGFDACGFAAAMPVAVEAAENFRQWIAEGKQACMNYMGNYQEVRLDPRLLVEGARSVVSVALNYYPQQTLPANGYQFAWYAYGKDYHDVMKGKLLQLMQAIQTRFPEATGRAFCDTAPLLERYWAQQCGLGWIGKNCQLIIPQAGSTFFLGELVLNLPLTYGTPMPDRCGTCDRCLRACPMHALEAPRRLNANRCLSYLTIENRGDIPQEAASAMGNRIYGCDCCQQACPWNRFVKPATEPQLQPQEAFLQMTREDWAHLTEEQYRALFKGSAVKRAKYTGLMRNIEAVKSSISTHKEQEPNICRLRE